MGGDEEMRDEKKEDGRQASNTIIRNHMPLAVLFSAICFSLIPFSSTAEHARWNIEFQSKHWYTH
jgi:hypothetical protein